MNIETIKALCPEFADALECCIARPLAGDNMQTMRLIKALAEARQALTATRSAARKFMDADSDEYNEAYNELWQVLSSTPPNVKEGA